MTSQIDPEKLFAWCRIPTDQLMNHPKRRVPLQILPTPDDVHRWAARTMADEVVANNKAGKPTRWILPCGPTKQYPYFACYVNEERISLKNVFVFHMDEGLDWEGRPLPLEHVFSFEGWMRRNFYAPIDEELVIPEAQRCFPSIYDLDKLSRGIEAVGGVDTVYGGIGYRGHIAFNEPPHSPWYSVTMEQFRNSKTRILPLNDDTMVALSQRTVGGLSHMVPPMGITIGMKDLLGAKRIRLISETGAWKQTVIRVLLFCPTTLEYPVTFVQGHPDVLVTVDAATAAPPLAPGS
jgi:glucosamine-6-phosphate deaminase